MLYEFRRERHVRKNYLASKLISVSEKSNPVSPEPDSRRDEFHNDHPLPGCLYWLTVQALPQHLAPDLKLLVLYFDEQLENFFLHMRSTIPPWAAIGWKQDNIITATNKTTSFICQRK